MHIYDLCNCTMSMVLNLDVDTLLYIYVLTYLNNFLFLIVRLE